MLICATQMASGPDRARNLDRLYRSWAKWNRLRGERLTDRDRALFSAAYLADTP